MIEKRHPAMKVLGYLAVVFFIISAMGCASNNRGDWPPSQPQPLGPEQDPFEEYVFQVGDVFDVKFFENPELDQTLIVRPDGRVSMPLVEEVLVAGLTPSQLDAIITEKYEEKITEPEATIILREFSGQKIYIGGEVLQPGLMQIKGSITLVQSIFSARGFSRTAKLDSVMVMRNSNNGIDIHRIDVNQVLKGLGNDFPLRPNDIVFVPKTFIANANDFIDQYINGMVPRFVHIAFGYNLRDPDRHTTTNFITNN